MKAVCASAVIAMTLGCGARGAFTPDAQGSLRPAAVSGTGTEGDADCSAEFGRPASMALDRARLRATGASPALLAKLDASAHRYSRLLANEVAARTCLSFRDVRWHLPVVAIHGDAHLEQFAVTPTTFGLEDFDQAGFGPAVIDLVRLATSIHLVCREVNWNCRPDEAVASYFRAYREALDHPTQRRLPAVATRMRARVPHDIDGWLAWSDSLVHPLSPAQDAATKQRWAEYVRALGDTERDKPRAFYDIVRVGHLQMGVGSALEDKLLFRVRGATDSPSDDVILEARMSALPTGSSCIYRPVYGGALYLLTFIAVLGSRMPKAFGTVMLDQRADAHEYWLQTWEPGYAELVLTDIETQQDLEDLAVDAARQLAGYFWTRFPDTLREHQRLAQLVAFDVVDQRARVLARTLADETIAGWTHFRTSK